MKNFFYKYHRNSKRPINPNDTFFIEDRDMLFRLINANNMDSNITEIKNVESENIIKKIESLKEFISNNQKVYNNQLNSGDFQVLIGCQDISFLEKLNLTKLMIENGFEPRRIDLFTAMRTGDKELVSLILKHPQKITLTPLQINSFFFLILFLTWKKILR